MPDGDTNLDMETETKQVADSSVVRLPYEKPALKHLGSVNRLTLALSRPSASDGVRPTGAKPRGG